VVLRWIVGAEEGAAALVEVVLLPMGTKEKDCVQ
jgi:hypothetical protein